MAKKRVNGEGTIGKRKDGRWEARYIVGRDPETGKQIRKSILGKTQAEVRTKLKEALAEATEIDVVKSGEYNVAGWVQAWYSLYAQPNVRETTARYYKGYIDHHVLPRLGDIPLNKLTSLDIQQFYKDLLENGRIREDTKAKKPGLSSTTVHGIHVMLKSALKRAVQERLIPFNPAEFCIPPKVTKPELQVIPSERYQSYLTAAEQRGVLPMFYLELATGLRKGEIAALLWSDYDAQTQTIHVTKQYLFYNGQGTVSPPKSSTSVRYVSIPEEAAKLLEQEHEKHPKNPYMFPSPVTGEMYHPDAIVKIHRKICKNIGLEHVRFHDLRHPYVKHTTKIFSLRLMDFQAQAYPDARRKTRGACQLLRVGQSQSPVRPLCNRKQLSCLLPQSKMSWILYAISMRLSGYTSTRSISSSASSVVSASASKIALDASFRLSCRACSSCFCFACANTAA